MVTKSETPDFSVITITRNNRNGLKTTAHSIQSQTNKNFEWIIIDGASTDGTQEDFTNYQTAIIISEPDNGIYDAMNKGIAIAKGNFLIFMNGGDTFADPDILDKIEPLTKNGSDLIYGDSMEAGHYKSARTPSYINWGLFTHHQAIFYNRIILGDMRYDTSFKIAADYDLTLHFLKKHSNTNYISEPICIFEQGGVSQTQAELGRNEQFTSRQKNNACSQCHNHFIRLAQKTIWTVREKAAPLYWLLKKFF